MLKVHSTIEQAGEHQAIASRPRWPVKENPALSRIMRLAGGFLPYLSWLIPVVDRLVPRRDALTPGLRAFSDDLRNDLRNDLRSDLRTHLAAIQATQTDLAPALADQQQRLKKLEEHAAELNHSLTNLSEDQLDLADQVRAMAGWVRNASVAALFLLVLLFALKLVQTVHMMGH